MCQCDWLIEYCVYCKVSGEAKYCDDIEVPGCLHAALVTSTRPHARLVKVDSSEATGVAGVIGYYSHADVPGSNAIGIVVQDEEVFASDTVTCVGQVWYWKTHSVCAYTCSFPE